MSSSADRNDERRLAGRALAQRLRELRNEEPIVIGLARSGIPAAYEVARVLDAPLDLCVVCKIVARGQRPITIGAAGEKGALYVNDAVARKHRVDEASVTALVHAARAEVEQRTALLRPPPFDARHEAVAERAVILVDDVIVTGSSARVAIEMLRARGADRIVLATPVASAAAIAKLEQFVDEVICLNPRKRIAHLDGVYVSGGNAAEVLDDDVIELVSRVRTAQRQHHSEVWSPWQ